MSEVKKEKPGPKPGSRNKDEVLTPFSFEIKNSRAGHEFIVMDITYDNARSCAKNFKRTISTTEVLVVNPATCETVKALKVTILT